MVTWRISQRIQLRMAYIRVHNPYTQKRFEPWLRRIKHGSRGSDIREQLDSSLFFRCDGSSRTVGDEGETSSFDDCFGGYHLVRVAARSRGDELAMLRG